MKKKTVTVTRKKSSKSASPNLGSLRDGLKSGKLKGKELVGELGLQLLIVKGILSNSTANLKKKAGLDKSGVVTNDPACTDYIKMLELCDRVDWINDAFDAIHD